MTKLKLALCQMNVIDDKEANLKNARLLISKACKNADFIILPEMFNCPYSNEKFIEYCERQHTESVRFWNKPTASGIPRDEQRTRYDQRRRDILPKHGIRLVEISFSDFPHDSHKRLLRNRDVDLEIVKRILSSH